MKQRYIFLILFILVSSLCLGYVNVYPLSFDQRIDNIGGIKDYVLTNSTNKPKRYQINILEGDSSQDMSAWTEVYPRALTLKPGEKGQIKMYTRAPKGSLEGEYSAVLNIKELEVPKEKKEQNKINVLTDLRVKLYGYVGNLDSSISLKNSKFIKNRDVREIKLNGVLKNESLRRINLEIILADSKEKNMILLSEVRLKKGEEIDLSNLKINPELEKILVKNSKLDTIYFYEKGVGKFLKKEKIRS